MINERRFFLSLLMAVAAALPSMGCAAAPPPVVLRTIPDCLEHNRAATFRIDVELEEVVKQGGRPRRATGKGSGVVINEDGYILTNAHVAVEPKWKSRQSITVLLAGKREPVRLRGTVVAISSKDDLAIIKVEQRFPVWAIIAEPGEVEDGESIYNIGYPYDFGEMVGRGYVNRHGFYPDDNIDPEYDNTLLLDIPDGPGTSGSGLFAERSGKYVGMMMAYTFRRAVPDHPPMVVRVGIPVERIRAFLDREDIPYHTSPRGASVCR